MTRTRLLRDYPTCTPFLARPWLDFMLRIPVQYRQNGHLYREIQKQAFPKLSELPSATLHGHALREPALTRTAHQLRARAAKLGLLRNGNGPVRANSGIRAACRHDPQLRELVRQNITDLAGRGILDWLDVAAFAPCSGTRPDTDESVVIRLLNVELNLKAIDSLAA